MLDTTELPMGQELDGLIALNVMGAQLIQYPWYDGTRKPFLWWPDDDPPRGDDFQRLPNGWLCEWNSIPPYSSGMAAAWEVVEHLTRKGSGISYLSVILADGTATACIALYTRREPIQVTATMAPLAICRAALTAIKEIGQKL